MSTSKDVLPDGSDVDAVEMLNAIIQSAQDAIVALKDEDEGRFKRFIDDTASSATLLRDVVQSW